ncbi:MAG: type II toxin-antitoxin system VapC family toxin [Prolixibacteraceae bacterium]|jgi:predicted nucleic acid-binding protein|nr:type II toxin-antitoxin system VapC family toxin [Prolixibacteraceae bacterium]
MTVYHRYEHSIKAKGCFLDTNIIIFRYFNLNPDDDRFYFYNKIIDYLLNNNIDCYISPTVISETLNACLRFEQRSYYNTNPNCTQFTDQYGNRDFKKYRNSTYGVDAYNSISDIMNDILEDFKVKPEKLLKSDISRFIADSHTLDFNDKYIADLCIKNNFILITHDKDFFDTKGLNIISMLSDNKK